MPHHRSPHFHFPSLPSPALAHLPHKSPPTHHDYCLRRRRPSLCCASIDGRLHSLGLPPSPSPGRRHRHHAFASRPQEGEEPAQSRVCPRPSKARHQALQSPRGSGGHQQRGQRVPLLHLRHHALRLGQQR
ncbi:unnamed protein product [Chondrus crispus]|uniref:Uncharacterized protein n=1 Tax=Chondrus crispus TaxID=2769 RepID=R7QU00_CHOCR|nr:unnamed protein product [Chondrus crispus]CDF40845.1 unnamed protein product [Chondrus crispus]|eukprot:XP_005711139.1 unnamed protein product [Chondrus crispus]